MRYLLGKEKRHRPPAAQVEGALPPHFRRRVYAAKGRWLGFCPPPMLPAPTSCDCSAVDASSCKRLGASCCQRCLGTASAVSNCTEPVYPQRPLAAWLRGARRGRCSNRHRRSGSPLPIAAAATLFSAEQRHTCVNGSEGAWFPSRHFTQSWARLAAFCLASCARFASTRQTLRTLCQAPRCPDPNAHRAGANAASTSHYPSGSRSASGTPRVLGWCGRSRDHRTPVVCGASASETRSSAEAYSMGAPAAFSSASHVDALPAPHCRETASCHTSTRSACSARSVSGSDWTQATGRIRETGSATGGSTSTAPRAWAGRRRMLVRRGAIGIRCETRRSVRRPP